MRLALAALGLLGCAHAPVLTQEQGDVLKFVWRTCYGRTDAPPSLYVRAPECYNDPGSIHGPIGVWYAGQCVGGYYDSTLQVPRAPGEAWHMTSISHEGLHAVDARLGIADMCSGTDGCISNHTAAFIATDTACRYLLAKAGL